MTDQEQAWSVEYYRTSRGDEPAKEFINGLKADDRAKVYRYLRLLRDFGTAIDNTYAKDLHGHKPLWELTPAPHRVIYFAYTGRRFIILHAFRKTRNKTRREHIRLAEGRYRDFLERQGE